MRWPIDHRCAPTDRARDAATDRRWRTTARRRPRRSSGPRREQLAEAAEVVLPTVAVIVGVLDILLLRPVDALQPGLDHSKPRPFAAFRRQCELDQDRVLRTRGLAFRVAPSEREPVGR